MSTDAIKRLASEARGAMETRTREDGTSYVTAKDEGPGWVLDLAHEAHGGMLPDDWRWSCIRAALAHIADSDDPEDEAGEFADGMVDTYTAGRLRWLASHLDRPGYVDQAADEHGAPDPDDLMGRIGMGQYVEAREVYDLVWRFLSDRADDDAEGDE